MDARLHLPAPLPERASLMPRIHDHIFRSHYLKLQGKDGREEETKAFSLLREGLTSTVLADRQTPRLAV